MMSLIKRAKHKILYCTQSCLSATDNANYTCSEIHCCACNLKGIPPFESKGIIKCIIQYNIQPKHKPQNKVPRVRSYHGPMLSLSFYSSSHWWELPSSLSIALLVVKFSCLIHPSASKIPLRVESMLCTELSGLCLTEADVTLEPTNVLPSFPTQ